MEVAGCSWEPGPAVDVWDEPDWDLPQQLGRGEPESSCLLHQHPAGTPHRPQRLLRRKTQVNLSQPKATAERCHSSR